MPYDLDPVYFKDRTTEPSKAAVAQFRALPAQRGREGGCVRVGNELGPVRDFGSALGVLKLSASAG